MYIDYPNILSILNQIQYGLYVKQYILDVFLLLNISVQARAYLQNALSWRYTITLIIALEGN